jgi:hypothetical protein
LPSFEGVVLVKLAEGDPEGILRRQGVDGFQETFEQAIRARKE